MQEIHKLRAQITNIVRSNYPSLDIDFDPKLRPPNETQVRFRASEAVMFLSGQALY